MQSRLNVPPIWLGIGESSAQLNDGQPPFQLDIQSALSSGYFTDTLALQLNSRMALPRRSSNVSTWTMVGTIIFEVVFAILTLQEWDMAAAIVLGIGALWLATGLFISKRLAQQEGLDRLASVSYEFDPAAEQRWQKLGLAFSALSSASSIRFSLTDGPALDESDHRVARTLLHQQLCTVGKETPPNIVTNVQPWCVEVEKQFRLYFMPQRMVVHQSTPGKVDQYGAIAYSHVDGVVTYTSEAVADSTLGERGGDAWHARRHNAADCETEAHARGESPNPPNMVRTVGFHLRDRQTLLFTVSQASAASEAARLFCEAFNAPLHELLVPRPSEQTARAGTGYSSRPTSQGESGAHNTGGRSLQTPLRKPRHVTPQEVLGVRAGASFAEIQIAWRALAQKYHPDHVATKGPEVRAIAERRMRDINVAYQTLKSRARLRDK